MAWILLEVPAARRGELETALKDDQLARQSQKLRDAASFGGPAGAVYVLLEGTDDAVRRADGLLSPLGRRPDNAAELLRRFKEEDEAASTGLGLVFSD